MAINPYPWLRVKRLGFVEEPASALFSLIITVELVRCLRFLLWGPLPNPHTRRSFHHRLWSFTVLVWVWEYLSSTLFHIHENKLTERMDYFGACLSLLLASFVGVVRVLGLSRLSHLALAAAPFVLISVYHVWYMTLVLFDYGWHVKLCIAVGVFHAVVWTLWCYRFRHVGYGKWMLLFHALTAMFLPLELNDFRPLLGHFDAHSLWHGGGMVVVAAWCRFVEEDVRHQSKGYRKLSDAL